MASYRVCLCFTRKFGIADVEIPSDVKEIFKKYAAGSANMTPEQLLLFLQEAQGEPNATVVYAEEIVKEVLKQRNNEAKNTRLTLTLDDFFFFLFSVDLNPPFISQVHQDMTLPLSHYFMHTGHNSYLTGNQLTSDCSDRLIIRALKQGVRVIELDLWPNDNKDDIHVLHGRTLTTPVDLKTCLQAIKSYAFESSDFPVIITLEDHLKPKLQAKAAQTITETFGPMLFCPSSEDLKEFPSPEELKYKILISTKPPKECREAESLISSGVDKGKSSHHEQTSKCKIKASEKSKQEQVDAIVEDQEDSEYPEPLAYRSLIAIHQRRKCKLKEAMKIDPDKVCRVSLSEQKLEKAVKSHGKDLVRFTQKNILRIYPKGSRFDSSNYNPFIGWMHGAQMIAFNMQGYGKSLWQMQGMFRANGGCGYVRKPDYLMDANHVFDPKAKLPVKTTLKVKIFLGDGWRMDFKKTHFDRFSPPDFYVKVGISGVRADETMQMTDIKDDQWTPVWNEEFSFPLTVPELALLRIQIHEYDNDKKDDFGGQNCLPIFELRPGIRAIPLYSHRGERYKSVKLLMRLTFL